MTDDEMRETVDKITDDLNEAMVEICAKNEGAAGGAMICALAGIVARAIWLYSADQTPAGRDNLLASFIDAVEDCWEQREEKEQTLQ